MLVIQDSVDLCKCSTWALCGYTLALSANRKRRWSNALQCKQLTYLVWILLHAGNCSLWLIMLWLLFSKGQQGDRGEKGSKGMSGPTGPRVSNYKEPIQIYSSILIFDLFNLRVSKVMSGRKGQKVWQDLLANGWVFDVLCVVGRRMLAVSSSS